MKVNLVVAVISILMSTLALATSLSELRSQALNNTESIDQAFQVMRGSNLYLLLPSAERSSSLKGIYLRCTPDPDITSRESVLPSLGFVGPDDATMGIGIASTVIFFLREDDVFNNDFREFSELNGSSLVRALVVNSELDPNGVTLFFDRLLNPSKPKLTLTGQFTNSRKRDYRRKIPPFNETFKIQHEVFKEFLTQCASQGELMKVQRITELAKEEEALAAREEALNAEMEAKQQELVRVQELAKRKAELDRKAKELAEVESQIERASIQIDRDADGPAEQAQTPKQPSESDARYSEPVTGMKAARVVCNLLDQSGMLTEKCDYAVLSRQVNITLDAPPVEARKICLGMPALIAKRNIVLRDNGERWRLNIYSPYSGDRTTATCLM